MLARALAVIVCQSIRLSLHLSQAGIVSKWLNVGSHKQRHVIAQGLCIVFWRQQSLVGDPQSPWNCAQSDAPPFKHNYFDQYPLIEPQPWQLAKKVQLALTESRPCAFQWAIDEPCTLPLRPPKGGTKRDFAVLPVKFNIYRKKSATKFICVKTSSGNVVATSFPYLTVCRRIAGDVPIYLKFALSDPPLRPALVAEWLMHSAAMCSRAWCAQWPGFDSARVCPPTKELFLIIPAHIMNKEIIPGRKKGFNNVRYKLWPLQAPWSSSVKSACRAGMSRSK